MERVEPAKQLEELIENALIEGASEASIRSISARVIRENPDLIEALKDEWILEHVARLVAHAKAGLRAAAWSKQIPLPGFEHLPMRLTFGGPRRPKALLEATHRELRHYLARLRKRQAGSPRISEVKSLMELIGKWKKKLRTTRQLTVAEAMEREAGLLR